MPVTSWVSPGSLHALSFLVCTSCSFSWFLSALCMPTLLCWYEHRPIRHRPSNIQLFVSRFPCKDGGFLTSTWLKRPATGHFQPPSQLLLGYLQYNFSPFKNKTEFAEFNETQKRYQAAISLRQICSAWRACLEDLLFDDIKDHRRIFLYGEGHWIESSPNWCLLLEQRSFTLL